jgi:hypothetical protein
VNCKLNSQALGCKGNGLRDIEFTPMNTRMPACCLVSRESGVWARMTIKEGQFCESCQNRKVVSVIAGFGFDVSSV